MTEARRLLRLIEADEQAHWDALDKTGFYGAQGAGCIILAQETKRFLIPFRSASVEQPHTYGTIGGAIDSKEDPSQAVRREVQEECGYSGSLSLVPLYVFQKGTFKYHNFLAVIANEFEPRKNWETDYFEWVTLEELLNLEPKHFGLQGVLSRDISILKRYAGETEEYQK